MRLCHIFLFCHASCSGDTCLYLGHVDASRLSFPFSRLCSTCYVQNYVLHAQWCIIKYLNFRSLHWVHNVPRFLSLNLYVSYSVFWVFSLDFLGSWYCSWVTPSRLYILIHRTSWYICLIQRYQPKDQSTQWLTIPWLQRRGLMFNPSFNVVLFLFLRC